MKVINTRRTLTGAVALATLAVVSCAKVSDAPTGEGDKGNVTSANPSGVATPAPSTVSNVGTQKVAMPTGTAPDQAPTPQVETPVALPSRAVLQAVSTTQTRLDAITAVLDGTRVRFVDCPEGATCTARVEAQSLGGLRDLLQSMSAQQGGIGFTAREQLDGYTGRTFVADVTLGTASTRAVPTDENELLGN